MREDFENKVDEEIRRRAANEEIPESLRPENIERKLAEAKQKKPYGKWAAAAAVFLVVCTAAGFGLKNIPNRGADSAAKEEYAMEESAEAAYEEAAAPAEAEEAVDSAEAPAETADAFEAAEENAETSKGAKHTASAGTWQTSALKKASDYDEIWDLISERQNIYDYGIVEDAEFDAAVPAAGAKAESAEEAVESSAATSMGAPAASGDYSRTNIQEEGVDEADIMKTDGKYFYVLDQNGREVSILKVRNGIFEETSSIRLKREGDYYGSGELYITGNVLTVILPDYSERYDSYGGYREVTRIFLYDVKDPSDPKLLYKTKQSGNYMQSRISDGHLYTFSRFYPNCYDRGVYEEYIPYAGDCLIEPDYIGIPEYIETTSYLVMTSVDVSGKADDDRMTDKIAVFSCGDTYYVSESNIYVASRKDNEIVYSYDYYEDRPDNIIEYFGDAFREVFGQKREPERRSYSESMYYTEIVRIAYEDGFMYPEAKGTVDGKLLNSFSMSEYKGDLRLVTTSSDIDWETTNNVYVLDEDMDVRGSIKGLAEDERIYSARFMGDRGYFVTYRETDPLFSVDLSDPDHPRIEDALKIPGFSNYLHFYDKDHLLGIGETDSGQVKLSMFDISDPADISEEDVYILDDCYYTEAFYDHHAVMIDPEKNIFGFAASGNADSSYRVFSYDGKKGMFKEDFSRTLRQGEEYFVRGFYIGDQFYLIRDGVAESFSLKDFTKTDDCIFR